MHTATVCRSELQWKILFRSVLPWKLFCRSVLQWKILCAVFSLSTSYGVATISRLFKIVGLFCKRAL